MRRLLDPFSIYFQSTDTGREESFRKTLVLGVSSRTLRAQLVVDPNVYLETSSWQFKTFDRIVEPALRASTFAGYRARPQHQRNTFPLMQSFFRRRCTFVKDSVLLSRGGRSGSLVRPNLDRARKYHRQKEGTLHDRNRTSSTRVRGGSLLKNEALFRLVPRLPIKRVRIQCLANK